MSHAPSVDLKLVRLPPAQALEEALRYLWQGDEVILRRPGRPLEVCRVLSITADKVSLLVIIPGELR